MFETECLVLKSKTIGGFSEKKEKSMLISTRYGINDSSERILY